MIKLVDILRKSRIEKSLLFYKEGFRYQLTRDFTCQLPFGPKKDIFFEWGHFKKNGKVLIKKYYAYDGPSGPTVDTVDSLPGALVHDFLYQLIRLGFLPEYPWREIADEVAKKIWKMDARNWFFRAIRYPLWCLTLRKFAKFAAQKDAERKEKVAP